MKAPTRVLVVAGLAILLRAPAAPAQATRYVAIEAAVGISDGGGGNFVDRSGAVARIEASGVVPIRRNVGLFMAIGYDWFGFVGIRGETCVVDPGNSSGGCLPTFPTVGGPSLTLGGALALTPAVELRAGLGAGAYALYGAQVGAVVAQAEATVFPVPRVGIAASARTVAISRSHQDRLRVVQGLVGIRLRRSASRP